VSYLMSKARLFSLSALPPLLCTTCRVCTVSVVAEKSLRSTVLWPPLPCATCCACSVSVRAENILGAVGLPAVTEFLVDTEPPEVTLVLTTPTKGGMLTNSSTLTLAATVFDALTVSHLHACCRIASPCRAVPVSLSPLCSGTVAATSLPVVVHCVSCSCLFWSHGVGCGLWVAGCCGWALPLFAG
jgi:hypothetical protein